MLASCLYGSARVQVYESGETLALAAAEQAGGVLRAAIARSGRARIVVATGNSQIALVESLARLNDINWKAVDVFHMDEYIGLSETHPSSFRFWIRKRVEEILHPASVSYIAGDAENVDAEIARYSGIVMAGPIDLAMVGFGENGHIAFNDPPVADFRDPLVMKRVTLDEACRRQQAGEGHFKDTDSVPREAITMTCPALFRAQAWVCCVPEARKAEAVRNALEGPISTACPAALVREHLNTFVYLDLDSAALLSRRNRS